MSTYYVDKTTGTSADTLLMAGFADFLNRLHGKSIYGNQSLVIEDCGPYWQIGCDTVTLTDENLEQVMPFDLLKLLVTQKQREKLGADLEHIFDYDAEQARRATFTAQKADLPSRYRAPGAEMVSSDPVEQERLNQIMGNQPDPDLPLFAAINQMKVAGSYNDLVQRWHVLMANPLLFRGMIRLLLQLFGSTPNPLEETEQQFAALIKSQKGLKPDATLLQIVNPTTGKGINRTKADSLALGGVDGCWLFELLKFAGFFALALPQRIQNSDDRKTYVLRARVLHYEYLQGIMRDFREILWSSSPAKLDVLAALYLAQVLIGKHRGALQQLAEAERRKHRRTKPKLPDLISGLDVVFYKSLGTSSATMNLSFVALPDWLPIPETTTEANRFIAPRSSDQPGLLTEHLEIIRHLEEKKGEEEALIQHYRNFLSSRDPALTAFFSFTRGYASYLMGKLARNEYVSFFSTKNLEVLMTARDEQNEEQRPIAPILHNEGFRSIARAIRESTIRAQYRVAQQNDRRYEIAYGLGQELARSLNQRHTFINALTDFVRRYNAETAREEEKVARQHNGKITAEVRRGAGLRRLVTTEDMELLVAIIDEYGDYKLVGNLLLAYGYAFDSSTIRHQEATAETDDNNSEEGV